MTPPPPLPVLTEIKKTVLGRVLTTKRAIYFEKKKENSTKPTCSNRYICALFFVDYDIQGTFDTSHAPRGYKSLFGAIKEHLKVTEKASG